MVRSAIQKTRQGGFTLLETLISVAILGFGLLSVVTMLDVSISASSFAKNTTKATQLAGWMMDRIQQDTSLATQPYTASIISLQTYMNSALPPQRLFRTDIAGDPPNEPGRTACQQWRALIQGTAIANYIGADALRGDRLPNGIGEVSIIPYDASKGGNHAVAITVEWRRPSGIFTQRVRLESILATSE